MILWKSEDENSVYVFEIEQDQKNFLKSCIQHIKEEIENPIEEIKQNKEEKKYISYIKADSKMIGSKLLVPNPNTRYRGQVLYVI